MSDRRPTNDGWVKVRRFGSGVVHAADVPASALGTATVFGSECVMVDGPVVALCGAKLRPKVVKMRDDQLLSCRSCSYADRLAPDPQGGPHE